MKGVTFRQAVGLLPTLAAALMVASVTSFWRAGSGCVTWLGGTPPIAWVYRQVARLPAAVALPLFVVPELLSRAGWVVSAWLLLQGQAQAALAVYAGSKLVAGVMALLVYRACRPALMTIRWFASLHDAMLDGVYRLRALLPQGGPASTKMRRARAMLRLSQPD